MQSSERLELKWSGGSFCHGNTPLQQKWNHPGQFHERGNHFCFSDSHCLYFLSSLVQTNQKGVEVVPSFQADFLKLIWLTRGLHVSQEGTVREFLTSQKLYRNKSEICQQYTYRRMEDPVITWNIFSPWRSDLNGSQCLSEEAFGSGVKKWTTTVKDSTMENRGDFN